MNQRSHKYRAVAEFEPQESVILSWPPDVESCRGENVETVMTQLVKELLPRVDVIVQCYYPSIEHAKKVLEDAGVDTSGIRFVRYQSEDLMEEEIGDLYVETTYPRDYGAEIVMDDEGNRAVIDFDNAYYCTAGSNRYTREATAIQSFGRWHASLAGIDDVIFTRLISEGGDREFNGKGLMMCIEDTEVRKRNPNLRRSEVEKEFKRLFNVEKVIMLPLPTFDDEDHFSGAIPGPDGQWTAFRSSSANGHIDEMCRFVNEDTVLLAEVTEEEAAASEMDRINKERLDMALRVLQNATTVDGRPLNIVRIPVATPYFMEIDERDLLHGIWMDTRGDVGDVMPDGTPFPSGKMTVLPAMSYCNFLITNGAVIGQKFWREGMPEEIRQKDEQCRAILQQCFPDREIVQINTIPLNLLGGGIHCGTHQIPKSMRR